MSKPEYLTVSEIIDILYTFVQRNPNDFNEQDSENLSVLEADVLDIRNLLLFEKKDTQNQIRLNQIDNGLKDMKQLLRIIEELDTSYICKPINGLTIHRDRVKFQNILDNLTLVKSY